MQQKVPMRLIPTINSNCCIGYIFGALVSLSRATVLAALATPAQLTSTRSWPCASRALAKAAATLSSLVTSTSQKMPPISPATCSPRSASRSKTATLTPLAASARAVASPRPEAPPVTTAAILLSSFISAPFRRPALEGSQPFRQGREPDQPVVTLPHLGYHL